jgi:hypothetical protein
VTVFNFEVTKVIGALYPINIAAAYRKVLQVLLIYATAVVQ